MLPKAKLSILTGRNSALEFPELETMAKVADAVRDVLASELNHGYGKSRQTRTAAGYAV